MLMLCNKVRIQMPFHSSPTGWPMTEHPSASCIKRAIHPPSSQTSVLCVMRNKARRSESVKHSNSKVSDLEIKKLSYTAAIVSHSLELDRTSILLDYFFFTRRVEGCRICIHSEHMPKKLRHQSIYLRYFLFSKISTPNSQHTYSSHLRGISIADANY